MHSLQEKIQQCRYITNTCASSLRFLKMQSGNHEKLCLQWNTFHDNMKSSFEELQEDKDFTDVTLACEDGQQVDSHKLVLIASSPFFSDLLRQNRHTHPLIYMRGVKFEVMMAMVDFFYRGEANTYQENLDSFLALAEEFQLKGLDNREEKVEDSNRQISTSNTTNNICTTYKIKRIKECL